MNQYFVAALDTREHPIKKAKMKIQAKYIAVLTYIVEKTIREADCHYTEAKKYVAERLHLYQKQLFANVPITNIHEGTGISCLSAFTKPWRTKYCFMLVCDVALILLDESLVLRATEIIKERLSAKRQVEVEQVSSLLQNKQEVEKKYLPTLPLLNQYRANKDFFSKDEKRIIVTANMSAGKSTLINALVGKPIARTSQEVCTGNVCYLFNKAYVFR